MLSKVIFHCQQKSVARGAGLLIGSAGCLSYGLGVGFNNNYTNALHAQAPTMPVHRTSFSLDIKDKPEAIRRDFVMDKNFEETIFTVKPQQD